MTWLGSFWWPFVRLSALLWALPVYDGPTVPPRAKVLLAAALSFLLAATKLPIPAIDPFSLFGVITTLEQILFGVVMALAVRLLFEVLTLSGLLLSMQMGLSMATLMLPGNSSSTSLLGHLFWLMSALLFFALDGHLITLALSVESFQLWPVGQSLFELNLALLLQLFGWMLGAALLLALPAIVAMLLVNLTFGVATRSAPSLNIFVLGFPMTLLLGFVAVLMTLYQTSHHFINLTYHALGVMRSVLG